MKMMIILRLRWEGLETARSAVQTMGSLLSSSAIPSLCTASECFDVNGDAGFDDFGDFGDFGYFRDVEDDDAEALCTASECF